MVNRELSENNFRVLALKYRPSKFSELVGQEALVKTLTNSFVANRVAHAFLLNGLRGVGKTTTARLIAKSLNCLNKIDGQAEPCNDCQNCVSIQAGRNVDVIEMDGASKTGINDIREIIETVYYRAASSNFKIYIIDEVHMLSNSAFNALLKTLEEPPQHVKFIFATTEIQKIPLTVLSRVQRYDLKRVSMQAMIGHLETILRDEGIEFELTALKLICRESDGSVRDALSLLDQVIVNCNGPIKTQDVNELIGKVSKIKIFDLLTLILKGNTKQTLIKTREFLEGPMAPDSLLKELLELVHFVSLISISEEFLTNESYTEDEKVRAQEIASAINVVRISSLWQILFKGSEDIKVALDPNISFEMLMIKASHMSLLPRPDSLIKNIIDNSLGGLKDTYKMEAKNKLVDQKKQQVGEKVDFSENQNVNGDKDAVKEILEIFPGSRIDNQD